MARSVVVAGGGGGGWDGGAMGAMGAMVSSIIQCGRIPILDGECQQFSQYQNIKCNAHPCAARMTCQTTLWFETLYHPSPQPTPIRRCTNNFCLVVRPPGNPN